MWKAVSKEYMAGFFDGEGSVIMQRNFQVFVVVSQSNFDLLKSFQAEHGGYVYENTSKLSTRMGYNWRLSKKDQTVPFLEAIKDFAIVKKAKIMLALEMLKLTSSNSTRRQLPNGLFAKADPLVAKEKQRILDQFKSLK